jgi:hypothetical protein
MVAAGQDLNIPRRAAQVGDLNTMPLGPRVARRVSSARPRRGRRRRGERADRHSDSVIAVRHLRSGSTFAERLRRMPVSSTRLRPAEAAVW